MSVMTRAILVREVPENERTPRKPAQSEIAESEIERIRRRA